MPCRFKWLSCFLASLPRRHSLYSNPLQACHVRSKLSEPSKTISKPSRCQIRKSKVGKSLSEIAWNVTWRCFKSLFLWRKRTNNDIQKLDRVASAWRVQWGQALGDDDWNKPIGSFQVGLKMWKIFETTNYNQLWTLSLGLWLPDLKHLVFIRSKIFYTHLTWHYVWSPNDRSYAIGRQTYHGNWKSYTYVKAWLGNKSMFR